MTMAVAVAASINWAMAALDMVATIPLVTGDMDYLASITVLDESNILFYVWACYN